MKEKAIFPDSGVYVTTDFGEVLFHHRTVKTLSDEQVARLAEHGIHINRKHFSPAEDRRIKENWSRLSEKYQLDYTQPQYYAGVGAKTNKVNSHHTELKDVPYWPEMCRGLHNRSARQVQKRIERLFDPVLWNPDNDETSKFGIRNGSFTLDDGEKLMYLVNLWSGNWQEISKAMNMPVHAARFLYHRTVNDQYIKDRAEVKRSRENIPIVRGRWLQLWNLVKLYQNWEGKSDAELVKKLVRHKSLEVKNFEEAAIYLRRNVDVVNVAWNEILEALRIEIEGGKSDADAFAEVVQAGAYRLTYLQRAIFANIYRKYLPPNCFALHNARKDVDMNAVDSKRKAAGLTGFLVKTGCDELHTLLHYTNLMIYQFRQLILHRMKLAIDARGILKIIVKICVRRDHEGSSSTVFSVEELVRFVTEQIQSDWIPPWKFERYILDEALRKNLVEDDNSNFRKRSERLPQHNDGENGELLYSEPKYLVYPPRETVTEDEEKRSPELTKDSDSVESSIEKEKGKESEAVIEDNLVSDSSLSRERKKKRKREKEENERETAQEYVANEDNELESEAVNEDNLVSDSSLSREKRKKRKRENEENESERETAEEDVRNEDNEFESDAVIEDNLVSDSSLSREKKKKRKRENEREAQENVRNEDNEFESEAVTENELVADGNSDRDRTKKKKRKHKRADEENDEPMEPAQIDVTNGNDALEIANEREDEAEASPKKKKKKHKHKRERYEEE